MRLWHFSLPTPLLSPLPLPSPSPSPSPLPLPLPLPLFVLRRHPRAKRWIPVFAFALDFAFL